MTSRGGMAPSRAAGFRGSRFESLMANKPQVSGLNGG